MQRLKNRLFRLYSPPLLALLGLSTLLFALVACGEHPVNVGCSGAMPPIPSLRVVNGVAYFGDSNSVYALRVSEGTRLWHSTIDANTSLTVVDNGIIYIGSASSLYALRASDGTRLWHFQGNGDPDSRFGPQPHSGRALPAGVLHMTSPFGVITLTVSCASKAHTFTGAAAGSQ